ncbi:hypothetical protein GWO73_04300 [Corynebacterium macginleyi]|uniref:hypothetical protein n=1 Tax=Corynebacterium macginleyi TaxID=38290 RepID=UPI00190968AE|nr:hypothetical protein [Corynebacterium macginleyi]MBK4161049.1 hypothetical protein [Corynebacterium macginleyi]
MAEDATNNNVTRQDPPQTSEEPKRDAPTPRDVAEQTAQEGETATRDETANDDQRDDTPADEGDAGQSDEDQSHDGDDNSDEPTDDEVEKLEEKTRRIIRKKNRENENLRGRLKAAEARADRMEIAISTGLPADAIKFLTGDTREEMEKAAEELLEMLGHQSRVTPPGVPQEQGGNPRRVGTPAQETDLNTIGARMYRR